VEIDGILIEGEICGLSEEEVEFIVKYYGIIPARIIAETLDIPVYKVYRVAGKLGLRTKSRRYPKYIGIRKNNEIVIYERD